MRKQTKKAQPTKTNKVLVDIGSTATGDMDVSSPPRKRTRLSRKRSKEGSQSQSQDLKDINGTDSTNTAKKLVPTFGKKKMATSSTTNNTKLASTIGLLQEDNSSQANKQSIEDGKLQNVSAIVNDECEDHLVGTNQNKVLSRNGVLDTKEETIMFGKTGSEKVKTAITVSSEAPTDEPCGPNSSKIYVKNDEKEAEQIGFTSDAEDKMSLSHSLKGRDVDNHQESMDQHCLTKHEDSKGDKENQMQDQVDQLTDVKMSVDVLEENKVNIEVNPSECKEEPEKLSSIASTILSEEDKIECASLVQNERLVKSAEPPQLFAQDTSNFHVSSEMKDVTSPDIVSSEVGSREKDLVDGKMKRNIHNISKNANNEWSDGTDGKAMKEQENVPEQTQISCNGLAEGGANGISTSEPEEREDRCGDKAVKDGKKVEELVMVCEREGSSADGGSSRDDSNGDGDDDGGDEGARSCHYDRGDNDGSCDDGRGDDGGSCHGGRGNAGRETQCGNEKVTSKADAEVTDSSSDDINSCIKTPPGQDESELKADAIDVQGKNAPAKMSMIIPEDGQTKTKPANEASDPQRKNESGMSIPTPEGGQFKTKPTNEASNAHGKNASDMSIPRPEDVHSKTKPADKPSDAHGKNASEISIPRPDADHSKTKPSDEASDAHRKKASEMSMPTPEGSQSKTKPADKPSDANRKNASEMSIPRPEDDQSKTKPSDKPSDAHSKNASKISIPRPEDVHSKTKPSDETIDVQSKNASEMSIPRPEADHSKTKLADEASDAVDRIGDQEKTSEAETKYSGEDGIKLLAEDTLGGINVDNELEDDDFMDFTYSQVCQMEEQCLATEALGNKTHRFPCNQQTASATSPRNDIPAQLNIEQTSICRPISLNNDSFTNLPCGPSTNLRAEDMEAATVVKGLIDELRGLNQMIMGAKKQIEAVRRQRQVTHSQQQRQPLAAKRQRRRQQNLAPSGARQMCYQPQQKSGKSTLYDGKNKM